MFGRSTLLLLASLASSQAVAAADSSDTRQNRLIVDNYATCVLGMHSREVAQVVLSNPGNENIIRHHPSLIDGSCLVQAGGARMEMPGDTLLYALSEALVRWEYSKGLPPDIAHAAPLQHVNPNPPLITAINGKPLNPKKLEQLKAAQAKETGFQVMSVFGECVAREDPHHSLALILTKVASKEEDQALADLNPALAKCVPSGQTVALDRDAVRGTIAMNLYRLAKAPRIAAVDPAKPTVR